MILPVCARALQKSITERRVPVDQNRPAARSSICTRTAKRYSSNAQRPNACTECAMARPVSIDALARNWAICAHAPKAAASSKQRQRSPDQVSNPSASGSVRPRYGIWSAPWSASSAARSSASSCAHSCHMRKMTEVLRTKSWRSPCASPDERCAWNTQMRRESAQTRSRRRCDTSRPACLHASRLRITRSHAWNVASSILPRRRATRCFTCWRVNTRPRHASVTRVREPLASIE